jgi:hypothetical protein
MSYPAYGKLDDIEPHIEKCNKIMTFCTQHHKIHVNNVIP